MNLSECAQNAPKIRETGLRDDGTSSAMDLQFLTSHVRIMTMMTRFWFVQSVQFIADNCLEDIPALEGVFN